MPVVKTTATKAPSNPHQERQSGALTVMLMILTALLTIPLLSPALAAAIERDQQGRPIYEAGQIAFQVKEGIGPFMPQNGSVTFGIASLDEKAAQFEVHTLAKRFQHRPIPKNSGLPDLSRIYRVSFPEHLDVHSVARAFARDSHIDYAEPIPINYLMEIPNDSMYDDCQHLPQIMAPEAWDIHKGEDGSEEVIVAVVDTGVDWDHPDLIDNIWHNLGEDLDGDGQTLELIGDTWVFDPDDMNGVDDDGNGFVDDFIGWDFGITEPDNNPDDEESHGTHVAGISVGATNNDIGIASISWNVKLMPIRPISNGYQGIIYAAENGADVVNNSWGSAGYNQSNEAAIEYARSLGTVVVAAAGNDNSPEPHSPSSLAGVISVASVSSSDIKTSYSNYGIGVDVSAPGGGNGPGILSTVPNGGYTRLQGTSMASPVVAGLVGLLKSYQPDWTVEQLELQILATADNLDDLNPNYIHELGTGRINAERALAESGGNVPQELRLEWRQVEVEDENENGSYEPEELGSISFRIRNYAHFVSEDDVTFQLSTDDPDIIIANDTFVGDIPADDYLEVDNAFSIQISADATTHVATLTLDVLSDTDITYGQSRTIQIPIVAGGVFVWEGVEDGQDYSGAFLRDLLLDFGVPVTYSNDFLPDFSSFNAVFLSYGNYGDGSNRTFFNNSMATTVQAYLESGGNLYLEGGDALGFDQGNNDDLLALFGLTDTENGSENELNGLSGQDGTITEGMMFGSTAQINQTRIDIYQTNDSAQAAFVEDDYGIVAVQNNGGYGQKTFCFSYAISQLVDDDSGSRAALVAEMLDYFGIPYFKPQFTADVTSGHAPLTVQFSDQSLAFPPATEWYWDFDLDGSIDASGANPEWTYNTPGTYSVKLQVSNGITTKYLTLEEYIRVFDGESALWFDGDDGAVLCPASPSLNLTDAMTLEAWIHPEGWGEVQGLGFGRIIDKGDISLFVNGTGGSLNNYSLGFWIETDGNPAGIANIPESTLSLDTWHHVAVTYDAATSTVRMYVDGEEYDVVVFGGAPSGPVADNSNVALRIGNANHMNWTFDGTIDEVRVWNTVRSAAQISGGMNAYLFGDEPGLVGYWRMNEGNGLTLLDGTTNANDGMIDNAWWTTGITLDAPTGIEDDDAVGALPARTALRQNYPNPFNPSTTIRYAIAESGPVSLKIFDTAGRLVKTLVDGHQTPNHYELTWDGTDNVNQSVASGLYLYQLQTDDNREVRRMLLLK